MMRLPQHKEDAEFVCVLFCFFVDKAGEEWYTIFIKTIGFAYEKQREDGI